MDPPTIRLLSIGALCMCSFFLLLSLIRNHPLILLALIAIIIWLLLHPEDAENLWRAARPAISESLSKANNCLVGVIENHNNQEKKQKSSLSPPLSIERLGNPAQTDQGRSKLKILPKEVIAINNMEKQQLDDAWRMLLKLSDKELGDKELGDKELGDDMQSLGGDIEIEPSQQQQQPDLLEQASVANIDRSSSSADRSAGDHPDQSLVIINKPIPLKRASKEKQSAETGGIVEEVVGGGGPDLISILNSNAAAIGGGTQSFATGQNSTVQGAADGDEFYITPSMMKYYERYPLEPLIITEQVPRTAGWFEELTEKQRAEWFKEYAMRQQRLSRSASKVDEPD